jgi:hypothetical protein
VVMAAPRDTETRHGSGLRVAIVVGNGLASQGRVHALDVRESTAVQRGQDL